MLRHACAFLLCLGTAACESVRAPPAAEAEKDLLGFLQQGLTKRQEVTESLGEPTYSFEDGRILAYRLAYSSERKLVTLPYLQHFVMADYELILVFDDRARLSKYKLTEK